jgi:hypothetical protein
VRVGPNIGPRGRPAADVPWRQQQLKGGEFMPGPQFLAPKPVSPSRRVRRFTLAQANRTLPLVRRIVSDIVRVHRDVRNLQAVLQAASAKDQPAAQTALDHELDSLQTYVDELVDVGCELKDFQSGLVDFIGRHDGHDVCLCWKLGEEQIAYWHEVTAGFAGRQPVATLRETPT